ncbi:MAG: HPr kinase/phosphorylase [Candidatus Hydrogenedentota bacterium]|nr:MAG: HPr kinase/phosphorylase [Candidatus Hydrogenedentota bacterium]
MRFVSLASLTEEKSLELTCLNHVACESVKIQETDINRPGLALSGFYDYFAANRIQIFGNGEWAYLNSLSLDKQKTILKEFFSHQPLCVVFTHDHNPPEFFSEQAEEFNVPVLKTKLSTHKFIIAVTELLDAKLSPVETVHGVMVEVFGVGILITGESGVGKSETALELLERGHRLVADDYVEITVRGESRLYGRAHPDFEHHMEIRGLGIVNIKDLFGYGSVRNSKRLNLVIHLEEWQEGKEYDRIGLKEITQTILGVPVAKKILPVRPGRNIPILIETAAKNHRLQSMGIHPARRFVDNLQKVIKQKQIDAHNQN